METLHIILIGAVLIGLGILLGRVIEKKFDSVEGKVTPVEPEPVVEPKRARKDGKFVADDPSTPDINEAWVGGKAPKKTTKKKKVTKKKTAKKKVAKKKTTTKQK